MEFFRKVSYGCVQFYLLSKRYAFCIKLTCTPWQYFSKHQRRLPERRDGMPQVEVSKWAHEIRALLTTASWRIFTRRFGFDVVKILFRGQELFCGGMNPVCHGFMYWNGRIPYFFHWISDGKVRPSALPRYGIVGEILLVPTKDCTKSPVQIAKENCLVYASKNTKI